MDYAFKYLSSYDILELPFVSFLLYPWCVCVCIVATNKEAPEPSVPYDKSLDHHCESHHNFF
jgi:hypothetical protein